MQGGGGNRMPPGNALRHKFIHKGVVTTQASLASRIPLVEKPRHFGGGHFYDGNSNKADSMHGSGPENLSGQDFYQAGRGSQAAIAQLNNYINLNPVLSNQPHLQQQ